MLDCAQRYVYETFDISKNFSDNLQVLLIRDDIIDNSMNSKFLI